ncbi:MAG: MBL fold metallo-hydrolase [Opitutae bacterium]|nr:MBL fold metallo-hydrolase [Opitutae bacterium]
MPPSSQLRVCVLASGSSGNCIHVESATTALLIDAGISARETVRRMEAASLDPAKLRAICVSHEHTDHVAGLAQLHKKLGLMLYANGDTARAVRGGEDLPWNLFSDGCPFAVGDVEILPFPLPHDAYAPVGFVLACGASRLGIATDLGMPTQLARERLRGCQTLVLEANHDEMLVNSSFRPWSLKQRILGRQGHLSNETAAALLADIAGDTLQQVFLAHLSRECNNLDLALLTVRRHLESAGLARIRVLPTHPDKPSDFAEC